MLQRLGPTDLCELREMTCSAATEIDALCSSSMGGRDRAGRGADHRKGDRAPGLVGSAWARAEKQQSPPWKEQGRLMKPRVEGQGVMARKRWWASVCHHHRALLAWVPAVRGGAGPGLHCLPPSPSPLVSSCEAASIPLPDALTHQDRTQAE